MNTVVQAIIPTQGMEAPLGYTHSFQKHGETECPNLNLKEQNQNTLRMQRYIRQVFFIVPKHKWTLFSFLSLFIKTLAITAPWISEVFYLSLFSVLSSCNKIYLSGFSCSASRFFFPCYCWDNVSFLPTAVNCVCWRGPEHSFSFVLPFTTYLEIITEQICKPPERLRNLGT